MLLLHTTLRSIACFVISSLVLISCTNHSKQDVEVIKALNESIESSNRFLAASIAEALISLNSKLNDPCTSERAKVWSSKANKIQELSKDLFDHLENIKQKIKDSPVRSEEIFEKIKNYQKQILQVDPKITDQFQQSLKVFTLGIDSSTNHQEKLFQEYFKNASATSTIALLNKLQNNIRFNEERIITFCNEHVVCMIDWITNVNYPFAIQSSTIVMPNESIEITAGLTSFVFNKPPQVYIYDKSIPLNADGFATYKFKVLTKPGKYYIPVKINYIDQDGRQQSIQKEIEYTVANIQKQ